MKLSRALHKVFNTATVCAAFAGTVAFAGTLGKVLYNGSENRTEFEHQRQEQLDAVHDFAQEKGAAATLVLTGISLAALAGARAQKKKENAGPKPSAGAGAGGFAA